MSAVADTQNLPQHIVMRGVSWAYYEQTLKEIGNQSIRVDYLDGEMELMSPLPGHERPSRGIGNLIVQLAIERQIPMQNFGSTTFRNETTSAGSEPDESFYFNEIDSIRNMEQFDPAIHRPPDLWVEVDWSRSSARRESIYGRLRVPEVWRYRNRQLTVRLLKPDGKYRDSKTSRIFPFLPMAKFASFIPKLTEGDMVKTLLEFRRWIQSLV